MRLEKAKRTEGALQKSLQWTWLLGSRTFQRLAVQGKKIGSTASLDFA
jgi:hypothetical protein